MAEHDMGPSTLNHGLSQCRKCKATDREIRFALGPVCSVADPEPEVFEPRVSLIISLGRKK